MLSAVVLALVAGTALAACPNGCSGNGECGANDVCACYDNYVGNDCSERMCPHGLSWSDTAAGDLNHDGAVTVKYAGSAPTLDYSSVANRRTYLLDDAYGYTLTQFSNKLSYEYFPIYSTTNGYIVGQDGKPVGGLKAKADEAHFYAECSGRGECVRASGECSCFDGFTGAACQRSVCPKDCSGNGVCMTVREVADGSRVGRTAATTGRNYKPMSYFSSYTTYAGVGTRFEYRHWDADKSQTCVCDAGFTGPDCSARMCPRGADPLVTHSSKCGNAACQAETQAIYIKLNTAHASSPSPVTVRFGYLDVYGSDAARVLYSTPFTLDSGRTAFAYQQQLREALASLPNQVLAGVNLTVSAMESGSTSAKVTTIYPQMQTLTNANDILEFKLDYDEGPQGNVNGIRMYYISGSASDWTFGTVEADTSGSRASVSGGTGSSTPASGQFFTTLSDQMAPANGNTPFVECSGRGTCDYSEGLCECFAGFYGPSCARMNALAQ